MKREREREKERERKERKREDDNFCEKLQKIERRQKVASRLRTFFSSAGHHQMSFVFFLSFSPFLSLFLSLFLSPYFFQQHQQQQLTNCDHNSYSYFCLQVIQLSCYWLFHHVAGVGARLETVSEWVRESVVVVWLELNCEMSPSTTMTVSKKCPHLDSFKSDPSNLESLKYIYSVFVRCYNQDYVQQKVQLTIIDNNNLTMIDLIIWLLNCWF